MVASAVNVLSVDEAKQELRLGGDTAESRAAFAAHDDLLTRHIASAVAYVEKQTGRNLLDRTITQHFPPPVYSYSPLVLRDIRDLKAITRIQYWSAASGSLSAEPDGEVASSGDLRLVRRQGASMLNSKVFPPAGGWPIWLYGSSVVVTMTVGTLASKIEADLQAAVVMVTRQLYDGYREIKPTEAFNALIAPWRAL